MDGDLQDCQEADQPKDQPPGTGDGATGGNTIEKHWWHVNRSGFPISEATWEKMWDHVTSTHPSGPNVALAIRGKACPKVSIPSVPVISTTYRIEDNLSRIQKYLDELQYNHTGTQFFDIRKTRPLTRLMDNAKEMIAESLPIKCLEAVILSLYLTIPLTCVQRFTISFKSHFSRLYYRHVVLGVTNGTTYGALGLSRRADLMYKPFEYQSLTDLVFDFINSYRKYGHVVLKVKLSAHISHSITSSEQIQWKFLAVSLKERSDEDIRKALDKMSRLLRS